MPPVMGAGAFIMAELLNISYGDVIVAAAIPAVLYYVALYCMADLEAVKQGLRGLPKAQLPQTWKALKEGWHLLIPVVILVYELVFVGPLWLEQGCFRLPQSSSFHGFERRHVLVCNN